ncbi:MAG: aspartate/glutamate racemase family protein [Rhodospirillaceae bacterium]|nr:aspartate/glutamate racemase family protein [Rhodospirillaceae bacterium]
MDADTLLVNRRHLPFTLDEGIARRAAIGLLVLATDHTIEHEWRRMLRLDGVAFYEARLPNSPSITPETLVEMEAEIPRATALIRPGERLDVIAYACTSGAMVIGEDKVFARIREVRPGIPCTTPVTAAVAGLEALGARRIALLTPYRDEINQGMRAFFEERGIAVPVMGSFNHENDNEVARISVDSLEAAAAELGAHPAVEAVFVACTSLRVADSVERLEQRLGKPVSSSNHALAWHALRLGGCDAPVPGYGRLMQL